MYFRWHKRSIIRAYVQQNFVCLRARRNNSTLAYLPHEYTSCFTLLVLACVWCSVVRKSGHYWCALLLQASCGLGCAFGFVRFRPPVQWLFQSLFQSHRTPVDQWTILDRFFLPFPRVIILWAIKKRATSYHATYERKSVHCTAVHFGQVR